jgi:hypothetical protein
MCAQFYVRYSCGHKGQHLGHKPCYHAQMIEAYKKPDSKIVLKNPIEYYQKECEDCSSEIDIVKKACSACILTAKGLKTVEKEDEEEGDDTLRDRESGYGPLEEGPKFSWLD